MGRLLLGRLSLGLLSLGLSAGLVFGAPARAAPQEPDASSSRHFPASDHLELMLRYMVEDGEAPAIALAVVEADGSTRAVAYGEGERADRPVSPGSVFEIGEITMTFTATLFADMVARGEVSPDDPVAMYLPEGVTVPSLSGYAMTLEHLADHRSGLPPEPPAPYDAFTVEDLYAFLGRYKLDWVPGRRRELSVVGYGLLGHALARAAGVPFEALLRERILQPLGMERTGYELGDDLEEWMIPGHERGDVVAYTLPTEALRGGTGLRSSAEDMAVYLAANAGPAETPLEEAMRVPHEVRTPYDPEGEGYGWSWRTYTVAGQPLLVTHGGRTAGFSALIGFEPEAGIGTVVLAGTRDFNDWTARDLLYARAPTPIVDAAVDPAILEQYVGAYGSRGGRYRATPRRGVRFIRLEDEGYLTYQPAGAIRTRLYALSDSSFYMLRAPLTVTFARIGDAVEMAIRTDHRDDPERRGRTWRAWKLEDPVPPPRVVADNAPVGATWTAGSWALLGLLGGVVLALILRPLWAGRVRKA